jgi:hypothetical protein
MSEWSIQTNPSGLNVAIRSFAYPGYEFKAEANSKSYSSAYFGTGLRNEDLAFML